jgi:hypothetical protein
MLSRKMKSGVEEELRGKRTKQVAIESSNLSIGKYL